jgi:hypothetical protein
VAQHQQMVRIVQLLDLLHSVAVAAEVTGVTPKLQWMEVLVAEVELMVSSVLELPVKVTTVVQE